MTKSSEWGGAAVLCPCWGPCALLGWDLAELLVVECADEGWHLFCRRTSPHGQDAAWGCPGAPPVTGSWDNSGKQLDGPADMVLSESSWLMKEKLQS